MEYKAEINKLKKLVSDKVWETLQESDAIIAGGAITSIFCNREVNDLDIYFRNQESFELFLDLVFDGEYSLIANNLTNRSVLFKDKETGQHVQAIIYKWFAKVEDIFKDYDYTCNMGAYEFTEDSVYEGHLVLHKDFLKHNSQRYLEFNEGTAYPLISALRVQKYTERGYAISKPQYLKILLAVAKVGIDSWSKLKDHVGGMYGLNLDEVFPEDQEFSLELAMETLQNIEADSLVKWDSAVDKEQILERLDLMDVDDTTRVKCAEKFFKNVGFSKGQYHSGYNHSFKYEVGEIVNGGKNGVYCYNGYEVMKGYYSELGHILELEPIEDQSSVKKPPQDPWATPFSAEHKNQLFGNVRVVAAYTHKEFIKKFKRG